MGVSVYTRTAWVLVSGRTAYEANWCSRSDERILTEFLTTANKLSFVCVCVPLDSARSNVNRRWRQQVRPKLYYITSHKAAMFTAPWEPKVSPVKIQRFHRGKLFWVGRAKVMQKGKVLPILAVNHVGGIRSTAPLILNLGIKQAWEFSFMSQGEEPPVHIDVRLVGPLCFECVKYVKGKRYKVKFTLEQAVKTQTGSRGIGLLFKLTATWGVDGQRHALVALPRWRDSRSWVPGDGLDGHGRSRLHRDSIPGPSSVKYVRLVFAPVEHMIRNERACVSVGDALNVW
jgi:hypothetical protein